jgi:hypothetical protein
MLSAPINQRIGSYTVCAEQPARWSVGGNRKLWVLAATVALGLGTGCFSPPEGAEERLAQLKLEGAELEKAVDHIEERLLGNQANLQLWDEMARRHRTISAVACKNHSAHFDAMVAHMELQQTKARGLKRRRVARASDQQFDTVLSRASSGSPSKSNN